MPPEYILEGILSIKYDVYSFGVTILETISSMCRSEPARHHASIPWVSKILHVHTNTSVFLIICYIFVGITQENASRVILKFYIFQVVHLARVQFS
jgi:hypothetical protein